MSTPANRPYGAAPSHLPPGYSTPPMWITVVVTLFFDLFGAIPAYVAENEVRQRGLRTGRYWTAFVVTLVLKYASLVFGIFLVFVLLGVLGSSGTS